MFNSSRCTWSTVSTRAGQPAGTHRRSSVLHTSLKYSWKSVLSNCVLYIFPFVDCSKTHSNPIASNRNSSVQANCQARVRIYKVDPVPNSNICQSLTLMRNFNYFFKWPYLLIHFNINVTCLNQFMPIICIRPTRFFPMPILGIPRGDRKKSEKTKNFPIIPAVVCSYTLKCYIFITLIY